jgi:hypothetical protein
LDGCLAASSCYQAHEGSIGTGEDRINRCGQDSNGGQRVVGRNGVGPPRRNPFHSYLAPIDPLSMAYHIRASHIRLVSRPYNPVSIDGGTTDDATASAFAIESQNIAKCTYGALVIFVADSEFFHLVNWQRRPMYARFGSVAQV